MFYRMKKKLLYPLFPQEDWQTVLSFFLGSVTWQDHLCNCYSEISWL